MNPHPINPSHEVEFQLIASLLKDGKTFTRVADIINKDNFHNTVCQDIFSAMTRVHQANLTIDTVTVGDQLQRDVKLDTIIYELFSGRAALSKIRELGNPKNVESYAFNVQDYWGKREISELADKFSYWAKNGRRAVDIFADARNMFDDVEFRMGASNTRTVDAKTAASRSYDEAVSASQGTIRYARTGLIDLDKWFRMRHGNLTIVAGRPGQGKTAFLVTVALNNAKIKYKEETKGKVLFLSMEMTVEEVTARFLSQLSGIPTTRILDGKMTGEEWQKYNEAVTEFEHLPIAINDLPAMTIQQIRSEARRHLRIGEDNLLIVDYLQLATSGEKKNNRVEEVGMIARGLKVYAGETLTPVLAAAQLSRAVEQRAEKRPLLSDLRESGNIEQDANNVIFLYQDEGETGSIRKAIVAKQRNGATSEKMGDVILNWNEEIMKFDNSSYRVENFGNR